MNQYVTGAAIKELREGLRMTQAELAERIGVSDKAVSKWETGRGYPDITLLEPLAEVLGVSLPELLSGERVVNRNMACNIARSKLYVCPVCGNFIHATGEALVSCCGVTLPPLEADAPDDGHEISLETVEDETFVTVRHSMTKDHYISLIAFATGDRFDLVKLYPEGNAEARFRPRGSGILYIYCNRHGLMSLRIGRGRAAR